MISNEPWQIWHEDSKKDTASAGGQGKRCSREVDKKTATHQITSDLVSENERCDTSGLGREHDEDGVFGSLEKIPKGRKNLTAKADAKQCLGQKQKV